MSKNPFLAKSSWVLDGGLATELERRGFDLNHPLWSAKVLSEDPSAIYDAHLAYLLAGAEIILTSSYQASLTGFRRYLGVTDDEARELLFKTVELACRARATQLAQNGKRAPFLVGASVGPYGAILADGSEYRGDYDLKKPEVAEYYDSKIEILSRRTKDAGVDFIAFETLPTVSEARLILERLERFPAMSCWVTFSRVDALLSALPVLEANDQVGAFGLNCVSPEILRVDLARIRAKTSKPLVVYPNGGGTYDSQTKTWRHELHSKEWSDQARSWRRDGANILGGCCGTGALEIETLAALAEV